MATTERLRLSGIGAARMHIKIVNLCLVQKGTPLHVFLRDLVKLLP